MMFNIRFFIFYDVEMD